MSNIVFIVNEYAGNGLGKKVWKKWKDAIDFPHTVFITEREDHATEIAKNCAESMDDLLLVGVGGDGTIHEIIIGVVGFEHVRIGIIAAGSGNDFGRTFSVFHSLKDLQEFAVSSHHAKMDIGSVKTSDSAYKFVNNAGFGFDAKVAYLANYSAWKSRLNLLRLGKLAYILYLMKELFAFKTFSFTLHNKEAVTRFDDVWFFVVCNQPYFGGGMKISPSSIPNDQLLELTVVNKLSRWKLLFVFGTVFFGKHTKFKEVTQFQASDFNIVIHDEVFGHVDGEFSCVTEKDTTYTCSVVANAWNLANR
ncbi:diacylglycerol/lipid kinase family protein [Psychrobacillus antarcticus]|uniref:diacylglycerol/lipid kinase family protein n=1 Tax=Psychrobacillus antarcticus TaxID=2879115 RepID=UPI00240857D1|nr:diacylglycerol kinase family protein [Psychrobacillus antarcticus]